MFIRFNAIFLFVIVSFFSTSFAQEALYIWGGKNNKTYLGCLNSNKYDSSSIWNKYGNFGSKYNQLSIWNKYGDYGSKYSDYSPWNKYSSKPPAVVDSNGNFYGYLTINKYQNKRAEFLLALTLYEYHELIRENLDD